MGYDLDELTLRELQVSLGKAVVALVRSEHHVSQVLQGYYPGECEERGDEIRIGEIEFSFGDHWFVPKLYEGPAGGRYKPYPGYTLNCFAPGGVKLRRHWHPDVIENVLVEAGGLLNVVSGKYLGPGEGFTIARGETHEYHFTVDTTYQIFFSLVGSHEPDYRPRNKYRHAIFEGSFGYV